MKRIYYLIIFISLVLINHNFSKAQNQTGGEKAKWTVMLYLDGDNDLEGEGIKDMNELEQVGSTDEVNFVVQFDRVKGYDNSNDDWTDTRRFRVEKDNDTELITSPVVQNLGEVNMGDPNSVSDFIHWSVENYPAERYMFIFWNHGGGWLKKRGGVDKNSIRKDVCWDETNDNDYLNQIEMAGALESTGVKFDIIGYDACLMGMIENLVAIRELADIVIASPQTEPGEGWDYTNAFAPLVESPDLASSAIAQSVVETYYEYYQKEGYGDIGLAAYKTSEIEPIITQLNALTTSLMTVDDKELFDNIRNEVYSYEVSSHIDLLHWTELLNQNTSNEDIIIKTNNLYDAILNAIIINNTDTENNNGLAIYLPQSVDYYNDTYESEAYLFANLSQWDEFLNATKFSGSLDLHINVKNFEGNVPDNCMILIYKSPFEEYEPLQTREVDAEGKLKLRVTEGTFYIQVWCDKTMMHQTEEFEVTEDKTININLPQTYQLIINLTNEDGSPASDCTLGIYDDNLAEIAYQITDENGVAIFNLISNSYKIEVLKDWRVIHQIEYFDFKEDKEIQIEIPPMKTLTVNISKFDGKPAANLSVEIIDEDFNYISEGYTDESGQISFELNNGNYVINVRHEMTTLYTSDYFEFSEDEVKDITLPRTFEVSFNITDTDNQGMNNLHVYIYDFETFNSYHCITDENGLGRVNLPQGEYSIEVTSNETTLHSASLTVTNKDEVVNIQLPRFYLLDINIVDHENNSVEGATIFIYDIDGFIIQEGNTDENGSFTTLLPKNTYSFKVFIDREAVYKENSFELTEDTPFSVILEKIPQLKIKVLNPQNEVVPLAEVSIRDEKGWLITFGYTDEEGVASFSLLKDNYIVSVILEETVFYYSDLFLLDNNKELTIKLEPVVNLLANITNVDDNPVQGALIALKNENGYYVAYAYSNNEGLVDLSIPSNNYQVEVLMDDVTIYASELTYFDANKEINIQLPKTNKLEITIIDEKISDYDLFQVIIFDENNNSLANKLFDDNGSCNLIIPDGAYKIQVFRNDEIVYEENSVSISEDKTLKFNLTTHIPKKEKTVQLLSAYPNPTKGRVQFNKVLEQLEIYDLTGRKVFSNQKFNRSDFDFFNYKKGIYLVKGKSGKQLLNVKIMVN